MNKTILFGFLLLVMACKPVPENTRFVKLVSQRTTQFSSGSDLQQNEIRYIDLEKNRERTEITSSMAYGAVEMQMLQTQICDGNRSYILSPAMPNHALFFDINSSEQKIWEFPQPEEQYFIEEAIVLGHIAKKYQMPNQTVWLWKGIAIKEESIRGDQKTITEPVSIEEIIALEDSLFTLPPNIKPISMYEMAEGLE